MPRNQLSHTRKRKGGGSSGSPEKNKRMQLNERQASIIVLAVLLLDCVVLALACLLAQ